MNMTLNEKFEFLDARNLTGPELRIAARTALACGDLALAARLREFHDADVEARDAETDQARRAINARNAYFRGVR